MFDRARLTSNHTRAAVLTAIIAAITGPARSQVSEYLGGSGTTTVQRGVAFCAADPAALNVLDGTYHSTTAAAQFGLKQVALYGGVPKPMGRNTPIGSGPYFGLVVANPTALPVTVTEASVEAAAAGSLFRSVASVVPASGWTRVSADIARWTGSVGIPPSSAVEFIVRVEPNNQDLFDQPITLRAVTSSGVPTNTSFSTTSTKNDTTPAVSLYYVISAGPAYSAATPNFGQIGTGVSASFTIRVQESEAGNTSPVPIGAELRIAVPAGWSGVSTTPAADFSVVSVTQPSPCTAGEILLSVSSPILARTAGFSFIARAPANLRASALFRFDTRLTAPASVPPIDSRVELIVEVTSPLTSGTQGGIAAPLTVPLVPQPMGARNAGIFGAAWANPSDQPRTIREVHILARNPAPNLFRSALAVEPPTGWTLASPVEAVWMGARVVPPHSAASFLVRLQGNDIDDLTPATIELQVIEDAGTWTNSEAVTVQTPGPFAGLSFIVNGSPTTAIRGINNGEPQRFRVDIQETEGGAIRAGAEMQVAIPARWSNVQASSQPGFGPIAIQQPAGALPGLLTVRTTRAVSRGRLPFTFRATAPAAVLQSLYRFAARLTDPVTGVDARADVIAETSELSDGGLVVRHISPALIDPSVEHIDIHLAAAADPSKRYMLQAYDNPRGKWDTRLVSSLGSSVSDSWIDIGADLAPVSDYLDLAAKLSFRVVSTGRECHALHEDQLRFLVSHFDLTGTSVAPLTTPRGSPLVPLEALRLSAFDSLVDIEVLTVTGSGNAPMTNVDRIHLLVDPECDGVLAGGEADLGTATFGANRLAIFGTPGSPLLSADVGADSCVIIVADIAVGATAGQLVGITLTSGHDTVTQLGPGFPTPSTTGYPVHSQLVVILDQDSDRDGIEDALELPGCTSEFDADTDDDGLLDGTEALLGTDPCDSDSDNDGIGDGLERGVPGVTDQKDGDNDGTPDEIDPEPGDVNISGTDYSKFTPDADPSTTTDPLDRDSDDDGLADGVEDINRDGWADNTIGDSFSMGSGETDASLVDTDGDGCQDGTEAMVFIPTPDTDLSIFEPDLDPGTGTSPVDTDTDDDGLNDDAEDRNCNGWFEPGETDPNRPDLAYVLRNDERPDLLRTMPTFAEIFTGTGASSLEATGPNSIPDVGEGPSPELNGSTDDDDVYAPAGSPPWTDPEGLVLEDGANRPLVFYQQTSATAPIKLVKVGTDVRIYW